MKQNKTKHPLFPFSAEQWEPKLFGYKHYSKKLFLCVKDYINSNKY